MGTSEPGSALVIPTYPYVIDIKSFLDSEKCPEKGHKEEIVIEKKQAIENQSQSQLKPEKTGWKRYAGIILALGATMTYSLATICITLLQKYDAFNLSFFRFQGTLLPAIPLVIYYKWFEQKPVFEPIWPPNRWEKIRLGLIIIIRSILGCTSTLFHIFALQYISMADASVIMFSCPVFVSLVAHISLGEKCGVTPIFVAVFTICGVLIITRPPMLTGGESFDQNTLIGTALALAGMILGGLVFILIRYLRKIHYSFMMMNYGLIGMLESALVAHFTFGIKLPTDLTDWILGIALAIFTFLSQMCFVSALKFENAGPVSLMQSTDVIFAFLWQFMFFNISPDMYSACGASIVLFGVFMTGFQKWVNGLPEGRKERRIFKLLLN